MPEFLTDLKRTHDGGSLRASDAGKRVVLFGWVASRRDHGGLVFIDLRDRAGITQVAFEPDQGAAAFALAGELRNEFCIGVTGTVAERGGKKNPNLATGEIEIKADALTIFSRAETPPFEISDQTLAGESVRLKHRYPRSAAPRAAEELPRALDDLPDGAAPPVEQRLRRDRDAVHGEVHAGRRAQLPRAVAPQPGAVLRARRVAADLQAALHVLRLRSLFPDRPLFPRRGSPPRPPAGVHADRHRDELRRRRRCPGHHRGAHGGPLEGRPRHRPAVAPAPAHVRRGRRQVRLRQARPALRPGSLRP